MRSLRKAGVDGLVSLLTPLEAISMGLGEEAEAATRAGLRFWSVPVRDHDVPDSVQEFAAAVEEIRDELHTGQAIAAHCYAGIGRSCVLLASILVAEGWTPELAFDRLSEARGLPVPDTLQQEQWVRDYAESLSHGALHKG
jgi:protein-tyrosine phosphatase